MSSNTTSSTRICPVCDAPNSAQSLFCAECGASLTTPADGDTAAYAPLPVNDDTQQTTTFVPSRSPSQAADSAPHATPGSSPDSGAFAPTWDSSATATPASTSTSNWQADDPDILPIASARPTSRRGFALGLLAFLLVLAVFLLWGWGTILDQDTRNSLQDLFGLLD